MSSSRSTVDRIEYFNVALPTLEEVEQRKVTATKRMRPGIKPKKLDNELTKEELLVRERRRKRNKEAAAKKRIEFKQTVGILESKKIKLESENDSMMTEVAQMEKKMARMKAALREHECVENNTTQQFFPPSPNQEFFSDLSAGFIEHFEEAIPVETAPADQEKMPVTNDFFDGFFSESKQLVAPTNYVYQQENDIRSFFGPEEPTKMPVMPPSYEETQQMQQNYVQQNQANRGNVSQSLTAMDLDILFSY